MEAPLIYFVAGEPSGDLLASRLMQALREKLPSVQFAGVGGETMSAAGLQSVFNIADISVMGIMEVLPRLRTIFKRLAQVEADIIQKQPQVLVTVDSWGFVQQLLQRLQKKGVQISKVHYVAPQVWAWKKGRAKTTARLVNHLMTLLPMEPPYFEKHGLPCTFVGHPVIENTAGLLHNDAAFRTRYGISPEAQLLTVLPGSRHSEVSRLIPVFQKTLRQLQPHFPKLHLLIPSVLAMAPEIEKAFARFPIPHSIITGQYERYAAFQSSCFALAASGTVSLELTACGTPHLIAYSFNPITNKMVKYVAGTRYANLINILADEEIIPEFVLERCRASLIAPKALALMQDAESRKAQLHAAQQQLHKLRPEDMLPSQKAAEVVIGKL